MFLPAFGTFPGVVSASVMSHKSDLRPLLDREQREPMGMSDMADEGAKGKGRTW